MKSLEYTAAANKALIGHTQWDGSNKSINTWSKKNENI
tara:strand:- start:22 stop:135 length:114 start_codon:yes stop_codon:yes gene_type:complete